MSKDDKKKTFKDELKESILSELGDIKELFQTDEDANDSQTPKTDGEVGEEAGLSKEEVEELKKELKEEIKAELKNDLINTAKSEVKKLAKQRLPNNIPFSIKTDIEDEV